MFRRSGGLWEVVFRGGQPFHLENTLGARYLDYLLHHPNKPIAAFDLEVAITPEKGEARARDSIQLSSDPRAMREYRQELQRLAACRKEAQVAGDRASLERLNSEVKALEAALKTGDGLSNAGERARNNVRLAVRAVRLRLESGGPEERAFAAHLREQLSLGYECLYSQPQGKIWN